MSRNWKSMEKKSPLKEMSIISHTCKPKDTEKSCMDGVMSWQKIGFSKSVSGERCCKECSLSIQEKVVYILTRCSDNSIWITGGKQLQKSSKKKTLKSTKTLSILPRVLTISLKTNCYCR